MKRRNIILFLFAINLLSISLILPTGRPHAAASMSLSYDFNDQELGVTISHSTSNPSTHFILSAVVRVNGTIDASETYTSQPTTMTFTYFYNVTAGYNANIQVTVTCNQFGTLQRSLIVPDPNAPPNGGNGDPEPTIPGYSVVLILGFTTLIIALILIRRNKIIRKI